MQRDFDKHENYEEQICTAVSHSWFDCARVSSAGSQAARVRRDPKVSLLSLSAIHPMEISRPVQQLDGAPQLRRSESRDG